MVTEGQTALTLLTSSPTGNTFIIKFLLTFYMYNCNLNLLHDKAFFGNQLG